jgi:hypothetical protein
MATKQKTMKGVSSITRNDAIYWYARVDGRKTYCGKGDDGHTLAGKEWPLNGLRCLALRGRQEGWKLFFI